MNRPEVGELAFVPAITLNDGASIPQLGFGTWKATEAPMATALSLGYRHIDTASAYQNEEDVGAAVRASGLARDEVFVTSKVWQNEQGYEEAIAALEASLERLGFDRVDLYLIHWPAPALGRYVETWEALIELRRRGLTRSIGVSNFQPAHLDRIIAATGVTPAVNQIELHPYLNQRDLRSRHEQLGIATEAWSPLADGRVLDDPVIEEIAAAHGRTPAQVVLRWHLQAGNIAIPKSSTPARIAENLEVFDFVLSGEQIARIDGLDEVRR